MSDIEAKNSQLNLISVSSSASDLKNPIQVECSTTSVAEQNELDASDSAFWQTKVDFPSKSTVISPTPSPESIVIATNVVSLVNNTSNDAVKENEPEIEKKKKKQSLTQKEKMKKIIEVREKKKHQLLHEAPFKLLMKMSVPTVISLAIMSFYTIADSLCIGNFANQEGALSALGFVSPIDSGILYSVMVGLSTGASNSIGIELGKNNMIEADACVTYLFFLVFLFSACIMVVVLPLLSPFVDFMGADSITKPLALQYGYTITGGCIGYMVSSGAGSVMRAMNASVSSMVRLLGSCIINIVLDILFMAGFGWGVLGGGIATITSTITIGIVVIAYWWPKTTKLISRPRPKYLFNRTLYKKYGRYFVPQIIINGLGSFLDPVLRCVSTIIFSKTIDNVLPSEYTDEVRAIHKREAIAAYGVFIRVQNLMLIIKGIALAWQNIAATAYGAKNFKRLVRITWQSLISMIVMGAIVSVICAPLAKDLAGLFVSSNDSSKEIFLLYAGPLLTYCISTTSISIHYILVNNIYQMLSKPVSAFFSGIVNMIFYLPAMIIFPKFFGFQGYAYSILLSDICSGIISISIVISYCIKFVNLEKGKGNRVWYDKILAIEQKNIEKANLARQKINETSDEKDKQEKECDDNQNFENCENNPNKEVVLDEV